MKNENVHMHALHHKLDVVLVQIPRYNSSETDYSFCEDSLHSRTPPSTRMRVSPSDPFSPHYFFRSAAPGRTDGQAETIDCVCVWEGRPWAGVQHVIR